MIVPLSIYAKNNSQSKQRYKLRHLYNRHIIEMLHDNFVSDLLSQEGRGGREEECLRDSRLCRGGPDGGHADRSGGGQAEVQQISPAPGEGAGHPDL